MKNFVNTLKKVFLYTENDNYTFFLPESQERKKENEQPINILEDINISKKLDDNISYLKVQYSALINSDIIFREFNLKINTRTYRALFLGIDGMIDSELVNNYLLKPLMNSNKQTSYNYVSTHAAKKSETLVQYIYKQLIPQNDIKQFKKMYEIISNVNVGNCALLVDTLDIAFLIDVKGYKAREISNPNNEIVVRGSQEAFVEKLRTNTSMLRRIISSENLIIESSSVGKISKTEIAICYMRNIANNDLVSEVKYRINQLDIDFIVSSGQLEQFIQDSSTIAVPQMIATERPDKSANHLLEGRVVILVNGSPYALIVPGIFLDFLSSPEDINLKHQYANLLRTIRIIAAFITLLLPGIYVAITTYHVELIPTELLFTIASARNTVPFPIILEILLMEIAFELIREAGLRIPTPIGPTIGIIGALVLGEAAVSANLVSPILIIIVAITGICSFSIPDFSLSFTFRLYKFLYIFLGYFLGFLGIAFGLTIQCRHSYKFKIFWSILFVPIHFIKYYESKNLIFSSPYLEKRKQSRFFKY